ncbi:MAG TPA: tRNA 2-selenouridine(34) synthase MnmH, partial [Paracoccus sp.]|nr:tRNA 2-selenouridine(34) synthase MnmH [Paracoccus sp. (in: a-proteobacteria)]
ARAAYTARAYADAVAEPGRVEATVARLAPLHPAALIEDWQAMAQRGEWATLAEGLMRHHYDPRYEKHRARCAALEHAVIGVERLDEAGLDHAAARVEAAVAGLHPQG